MWVGILILCTTPVIGSCQIVTSPHGYLSKELCEQELAAVTQLARQRGIINLGACSFIEEAKGSEA